MKFFFKLFTFVTSLLNFLFLTYSLCATSLNTLKSTGTVFNLPTSKSFTFVLKLFKQVGTLVNLLMSNLST